MKKIIAIVLTLVLLISLVGCGNTSPAQREPDSRFKFVETTSINNVRSAWLMVDTETGVLYLYKGDAITLLVDAEGNPLLWDGQG